MAREIDRVELFAKLEDNSVTLLDAQGPGWFEREHLPGAIQSRIDDPETTLNQLGNDLDAEIVVYCYSESCSGSVFAAELLEGRGYRNVRRYVAGKLDWIEAGLPVESDDA